MVRLASISALALILFGVFFSGCDEESSGGFSKERFTDRYYSVRYNTNQLQLSDLSGSKHIAYFYSDGSIEALQNGYMNHWTSYFVWGVDNGYLTNSAAPYYKEINPGVSFHTRRYSYKESSKYGCFIAQSSDEERDPSLEFCSVDKNEYSYLYY